MVFFGKYWKISSKWASKQLDCTFTGIQTGCQGKCCYGPVFWPGKTGGNLDNSCFYLEIGKGCKLKNFQKPVTCLLFPFKLQKNNNIVLYGRACIKNGSCGLNYKKKEGGLTIIENLKGNLITLFGEKQTDRIILSVLEGKDCLVEVPENVLKSYEKEKYFDNKNIIPLPRLKNGLYPDTKI